MISTEESVSSPDLNVAKFTVDAAEGNSSTEVDMNDHAASPNRIEKTLSATEGPSTQLAGQTSPQRSQELNQEWRAGKYEWMIIIVLAIVSLMVALDATILVPVLPVSALNNVNSPAKRLVGNRERSPGQRD